MEVVIAGQPLSFQVFGSGYPLIILPGWGQDGGSWSSFAERLSDRFQVFLIDFPGTGFSPAPDKVWNADDYKLLVEEFCRELGIKSPILLGHSHGGKIACLMTAQSTIAPRALIVVSASGTGTKSLTVRAKIFAFKLLKAVALNFGDRGKKIVDRARAHFGSSDYRNAGPMQSTLVRLVNTDIRPSLSRISVPTLILWGDKDQTLPVQEAKNFRSRIRGSFIRILWDSGHFPHHDEPEAMAAIVKDFVGAAEEESPTAPEANRGF